MNKKQIKIYTHCVLCGEKIEKQAKTKEHLITHRIMIAGGKGIPQRDEIVFRAHYFCNAARGLMTFIRLCNRQYDRMHTPKIPARS